MIDVDFHVRRGTRTFQYRAATNAASLGILGPSGSGKSTLLHCIAGLLRPESGRITVQARTLDDTGPPARHVPATRRGMGCVFQDDRLFPHLSVEKNLTFGPRNRRTDRDTLKAVCNLLEITDLLNRRPASLSGGEQRRVSIGRALLSRPVALLLDEPLAGLDPRIGRVVMSLIRRVRDEVDIPMIVVSHAPGEIAFLCEDAWLVQDGTIADTNRAALVCRRATLPADGETFDNHFVAERLTGTPDATLASYRIGTQCLRIPERRAPDAREVLLTVSAHDVLIASEPPGHISARNVLAGQVISIASDERSAMVEVDVGVRWLVKLTCDAVRELQLAEGRRVWAIVKASAIHASQA